MLRATLLCLAVVLVVTTGTISADEASEKGEKLLGGMSIVGNDEAPKSLVIVPWKGSELGDTLDISRSLGDDRGPVDRDVFTRELEYYDIRAGTASGPGPASP